MPQTSLLNFFNKTPKAAAKTEGKSPLQAKNSGDSGNTPGPGTGRFIPGRLVWAKLPGYPWWPSIICNHPTTGKAERKREVHVQFFDDPVTRSWIDKNLIKPWSEKVDPQEPTDETWKKGLIDAKKVENLTNEERLETVLVDLLPSDEEWEEEDFSTTNIEVSPGSKENDPNADNKKEVGASEPKKKRRRIMMMDSDDSGDDQTFVPSKEDMNSTAEDDDAESGVSEHEPSTDEEEDDSPVKAGSKRKRPDTSSKNKKAKSSVSTPARTFPMKSGTANTPKSSGMSSFLTPKSTPTSAAPKVHESTKKKLAMFGAETSPSKNDEGEETHNYKHKDIPFLKQDKIKDKDGRRPDDPDYNPRTLFVPSSFLESQSPCQRQWWETKSQYYDVVLFFKMGKFYELFHMDADVGVSQLNLNYMKGDYAHAGFPEVAYSRYASTLVEKGYKVARIEQTETPAMMEERCKAKGRATKFDKVVAREVCQLSTRGTRINNFLDSDNFEGEPRYLLSICESDGTSETSYGLAFVDTTIGTFHMGQFKDDKNLSRLRTLIAHYPPVEVLHERNGLTNKTNSFLSSSLPGIRKEVLKPGAEFWNTEKTLNVLAEEEYFNTDGEEFTWPGGLQPFLETPEGRVTQAKSGKELAVRALGGVIWYLRQGFLDQELLSLKRFEEYTPVDHLSTDEIKKLSQDQEKKGPTGKYMVLDGITVRNLDLVPPPVRSVDSSDGSLLSRLDTCLTAMGKRILRHWMVTPLLQINAIRQRQSAVRELMTADKVAEVRTLMKKIPDLERLISKIHTVGDAKRNKTHPDSRAIMFENDTYTKRKIMDLLQCLDGLKRSSEVIKLFRGSEFESKILKNITGFEKEGGEYPDLTEVLDFFDNAFDHASARKEGKIIPSEGVDGDLDAAEADLRAIKKDLDAYLKEQKKHFGCEVKYWGTGKNRFQLEIPVEKVSRAGSEYTLASGTKKLKRYTTEETVELLARQTASEADKEAALQDIQRKMFNQFSNHANVFRKAIGCISLLDGLLSLASYSSSLETSCFPEFVPNQNNLIEIKDGSHPCLDLQGDAFIPNDTVLETGKSLIILTGPNMGGKSTLMRQTGLLVVLAQMGTAVPASEMRLAPVDRIFTRLGAQDNIIGGESTFLVELQETSAILQHATQHSLVLIDELGRGTATYDGTAIAGAVVSALAKRECRTLFATHYHTLTADLADNVTAAHMACMVENEGHEDITQETITFLYKLVEGPCPKSHGFNAAKLAGLPDSIIRRGYAMAKEFEANEKRRQRGD